MSNINDLLSEYGTAPYERQNEIYDEICVNENIDELINSFSTKDQTIIQSANQMLLDLDTAALKRLMIFFATTKDTYIENYAGNTIKFFDDNEILDIILDFNPEDFNKNELNKLISFVLSFLDLKEFNNEEIEKLSKFSNYVKDIYFIQKLELDDREINNDDLNNLRSIFDDIFKSNNQEILQNINLLEVSDNNKIPLTKTLLPLLKSRNPFVQQNSLNFLYSIANDETKKIFLKEHLSQGKNQRSQIYQQNLSNLIEKF